MPEVSNGDHDRSVHRGAPVEGGDDRAARQLDLLAAVAVMGAIIGFIALKTVARLVAPRPTERQCIELLDRYLEHASRARDPRIDDDDIAKAKLKSQGEPTRLADLEACQEELSASEVECGLRSPNVDEMERCVQ